MIILLLAVSEERRKHAQTETCLVAKQQILLN
jgi:hypothetical protein